MKIAISGSTGFIAKKLKKYLEQDYEIISIYKEDFYNNHANLIRKIKQCDVVINLSGYSIFNKWTKDNQNLMVESRVYTTRKIAEAISITDKNITLINNSAIGIYDTQSIHTEKSTRFESDFLARLVRKWEAEVNKIDKKGVRKVIFRLAIVLEKDGGMLKKIMPLFKFGMGAKLGTGEQYFSFIHMEDLLRAYKFAIENKNMQGIYNLSAPGTTTNLEFSKELANNLNRSLLFKVPGKVLQIIFGERADLMLKGQQVKPARLLEENFEFEYPNISMTLRDLVK
ncbi:MAG: TIGR01777 family oxidoreductase [bacterium]